MDTRVVGITGALLLFDAAEPLVGDVQTMA